jgi:putative flavoprotein involved in K+ transport
MKRARHEVGVVGAGQAGLAIGHFLARQGREFVILEAADSVGAAWRGRWDSLVLFTPRRYDALPGLAFPGEPDGYPTRGEVVSYLERYASTFGLPVELNSRVRSLTAANGGFVLELGDRVIEADQVVVATGPFQTPRTPDVAHGLAPEVFQRHGAEYRNPDELPDGTVLVVGGGNTGFQIAHELAGSREVHLSIGSRQITLPQRFLGRDLFWYLEATGLMGRSTESRIGRRMKARDPVLVGSSPRALARNGVARHPRAVTASGRTVGFADGSALDVDGVIWATGYRSDIAWITPPVTDAQGRVLHRRGVTDVPGLYFLGLPWQHTRGSALLGWVKHDAAYIAERVAAFRAGSSGAPDQDADGSVLSPARDEGRTG